MKQYYLVRSFCIFLFILFASPLIAQPTISSFTPTSGDIGTTVTIIGTGFGATATDNIVYFGAVKATVSASTATSLTVTVPIGATYQPIIVTTGGLTASSRLPFVVTFTGAFSRFSSASFETPVNITANVFSSSCTGDFDGDGKIDIAVTEFHRTSLNFEGGIAVYRNNGSKGTISFATEVKYLYAFVKASANMDLLAADIDGDGLLDIVVNIPAKQELWVFKNTSVPGNISFEAPISFNATADMTGIAAGDLDGDGKTDIVVGSYSVSKILVFKNTSTPGTLSFNPKLEITDIKNFPISVTIADIDGDNKADLEIGYFAHGGSHMDEAVSILKNNSNNGNISFAPNDYLTLTPGYGIRNVQVGDIDGDAIPDLLVTDTAQSSGYILRNSGTSGQYKFVDPPFTYSSDSYSALADLDGDQKVDIASSIFLGIALSKNKSKIGNIVFADTVMYGVPAPSFSWGNSCLIADFDGDGKPDAFSTLNNTNISIIRNKIGESTVIPSGANPVIGQINKKVIVDPSVQSLNGQAFVQRHYDVEPANNPSTATATVTLYFSQNEFDNFNAFPGHGADLPTGPTDNAGKANLRVFQNHGFSTTNTPGSYSGSTVVIDPDDGNINWNAGTQLWEVTFPVTGFSGFFVSSLATSLPLKLLSFTATAQGANALLKWSTTNEVNTSYFELQRSTYGSTFTPIAKINAAGNNSNTLHYQYTDTPGADPVYYYRLKMVDIDGASSLSDIVKIALTGRRSPLGIYPNPARNYITVEHPAGDAQIQLADLSGKVLQQVKVPKNSLQSRLNIEGLAPGTYQVILSDGTKTLVQSLLIL